MESKKNIQVGKNKEIFFFFTCIIYLFLISSSMSQNNLEGTYTDIKILDKISSKNILLKIKNGKLVKFKDLSIKSLKCKNSKFDDNPEITAYLQVRDLKKTDKDRVFIFNGWTFASDPSLTPFDHAIYDLQLINCSKA